MLGTVSTYVMRLSELWCRCTLSSLWFPSNVLQLSHTGQFSGKRQVFFCIFLCVLTSSVCCRYSIFSPCMHRQSFCFGYSHTALFCPSNIIYSHTKSPASCGRLPLFDSPPAHMLHHNKSAYLFAFNQSISQSFTRSLTVLLYSTTGTVVRMNLRRLL